VPREVSEKTAAISSSGQSDARLVAKNMAYLAAGQVLTIPVSVILNALYARYLGAVDFGLIYLAVSMSGFGTLVVEWGQQGVLPALIARDRSQAATLLGTGFAWRGAAACVIYLFLAALSVVLGYGNRFQWVLALVFLGTLLTSLGGGYKDSIRGFERTDIPAVAHVAQQFLLLLAVLSVLLLGGRLNSMLYVGIFVPFVALLGLSYASKRVGIGALEVHRKSLGILLAMGTPFVFNDMATLLQPVVDAMFLSRLAPAETVGWYAASRRLVGILILPTTTLIGGLYPTLCRLWAENKDGFAQTTRDALSGIALLAAPAALGCALFPEIGVAVFGEKGFGPAEGNLRVMAVFVFLIYFTIPIGTAVLAAGKQRAWSIVQLLCVVVSVVLDPVLVPWFQGRMGNGGIGLCVAAVISESLVIIGGIALVPRGVLDRSVFRTIALTLLSGAAMALVAFVLKGRITPFVAAPVALLTYFATALVSGAITKSQRDAVLDVLRRRLGRFL
jgi:O-antigen/teichoic acid export membrane protein